MIDSGLSCRSACVALCAAIAIAGCAAEQPRHRSTLDWVRQNTTTSDVVVSWGGYPLDDRVTSLWLSGPATGPSSYRTQPLMMVYYVGPPGWHQLEWTFAGDFSTLPALARLESAGYDLRVEYFNHERAIVQGAEVDPSCANVFVVTQLAGSWSVSPAAKVVFDVPTGVNPGAYVSSMYPAVSAALIAATH